MKWFLCLALCLLTGACSSTRASVHDRAFVTEMHSAYVVVPDTVDDAQRLYDVFIWNLLRSNLALHGVEVTQGPASAKPASVDAYVTFVVEYSGTVYEPNSVTTLEVNIYRRRDDLLVASGRYHNAASTFFEVGLEDKPAKVIEAIYREAEH